MQTELPSMIALSEKNYQLNYSESYTGNLHHCDSIIEGYQYSVSIDRAFESLLLQNYSSFILTIECIGVSIYHTDNGSYKIFDSHARDEYGRSHPSGTCVLLEVPSIQGLVQYFQTIHSLSDNYELRGVQISTYEITAVNSLREEHNCSCKQCSAVGLYAMRYSVAKSCSYWNSRTLCCIADQGNKFYRNMGINRHLKRADLYTSLDICGVEISVQLKAQSYGMLSSSLNNTQNKLENLIFNNYSGNTGFLLWLASYCITCIFQQTVRAKYMFSLLTYEDTCEPAIQQIKISGIPSLVQAISNIVTKKLKTDIVHYEMQFLSCTSNMDLHQIKHIMQKDRRKYSYDNLEPAPKKKRLQQISSKNKIKYKVRQQHESETIQTIDVCIKEFKEKIREGPYYVCCVCNRMLYKKSVKNFLSTKYHDQHYFSVQTSFDGKEYICNTCNSKVKQGKVPCQALINNMYVDDTPVELASLEKLEQILIAQRIVFQKIIVMPKGQQRKVKGAICNVPVECDQTSSLLPRPPERSGIILLKLKRKLQFRGHVYFQAVRPHFVLQALQWLKANNILYKDIQIDVNNIDTNLTVLHDTDNSITENEATGSKNNSITDDCVEDSEDSIPINQEKSPFHNQINDLNDSNDNNEEIEDPLNEYRMPINQTCLQSIIPNYPVMVNNNYEQSSGNEIYNIAPGENKHPVSFMTDKQCEELAFPVLFPKGRYGYTAEREIMLSPVKYFNARLLHYSGRFATNPEYLFFAQFIIEQKKVSDSINIALKKVHGHSVTAAQLRSNPQGLQNLICQDQVYLFLRQIPGTPPYWQKFMYEVVAMVKQLGIPTWFMTLSCADLRWPELFQIIAKMQRKKMTIEELDALSYNERCQMLNTNPVIVAKHFQYRVETFFKEVLLSKANPIGKIVYYALHIEFQMRGSPHLHALIWTSDCPKLTDDNKQA